MKNSFKKLVSLLLATVMLCGIFSSCGDKEEAEDNTQPVSDTAEAPDTTGAEDTQTEQLEIDMEPLEKISVSTTGGVVMVGTVKQDAEGWYLVPEQPLDVEFCYFPEEPFDFTDVERIYLFPASEDGVDKAVYQGSLVTIEGTFTIYRDYFDRLYLLPYRIYAGKTVEKSCAAPELQPTEDKTVDYDPTLPLPEKMETVVENGHYVYNMYRLFPQTLEFMGNAFADFYIDLVDAVLNYETECPCPDEYYAQMLTTVMNFEFPVFDACIEPFEYHRHYDANAGVIHLEYKYDKAEHDALIERFQTAANGLLADAVPNASQRELAKSIYHSICTRMTYDYSALDDLQRKSTYYAYLENTGVCITFANVYNQLLWQVGIHADLATGDQSNGVSHAWSVANIDGKNYFFDPTFELNFLEGTAYCYFGMSYDERTQNNLGATGMFVGMYKGQDLDPTEIAEIHIPF